jgi:hypothetical protein
MLIGTLNIVLRATAEVAGLVSLVCFLLCLVTALVTPTVKPLPSWHGAVKMASYICAGWVGGLALFYGIYFIYFVRG